MTETERIMREIEEGVRGLMAAQDVRPGPRTSDIQALLPEGMVLTDMRMGEDGVLHMDVHVTKPGYVLLTFHINPEESP